MWFTPKSLSRNSDPLDSSNSGRFERTVVQKRKTHAGITGLREPFRTSYSFDLTPRFNRSYRQSGPRGLQADLHIWMVKESQKRSTLIAFAPFQLLSYLCHPIIKPIELCDLTTEKRSILLDSNLSKPVDQRVDGHDPNVALSHGWRTPYRISARCPMRIRSSHPLSFKYSRGDTPPNSSLLVPYQPVI